MKIILFLKSKSFWANALIAILFLVLVFWLLNIWLNSYTRHGDNIQVPELSRLSLYEAQEVLEALELEGVVLDSAEYTSDFPRGSIITQYPNPGSYVKIGRQIQLTMNPVMARKYPLPDLIEKTKRRAIYDLESKGFKVGVLEYVPYLGKDVVVGLKIDGKKVTSDTAIIKGTVIDLILGQGLSQEKILVPYLRWLNKDEAEEKILSNSLNLGVVLYDEEVEDSSKALVYKQSPNPSLEPIIYMGQQIDIWLTEDYTKILVDSLDFQINIPLDSTNNENQDTIITN